MIVEVEDVLSCRSFFATEDFVEAADSANDSVDFEVDCCCARESETAEVDAAIASCMECGLSTLLPGDGSGEAFPSEAAISLILSPLVDTDTFLLKTADHVVAITIVPSLTSGWMPINGCCVHLITTLNIPMSDMRAFGGECHGGRSGGRYPEPGTWGVRRLKVTSVPITKSRMLT